MWEADAMVTSISTTQTNRGCHGTGKFTSECASHSLLNLNTQRKRQQGYIFGEGDRQGGRTTLVSCKAVLTYSAFPHTLPLSHPFLLTSAVFTNGVVTRARAEVEQAGACSKLQNCTVSVGGMQGQMHLATALSPTLLGFLKA